MYERRATASSSRSFPVVRSRRKGSTARVPLVDGSNTTRGAERAGEGERSVEDGLSAHVGEGRAIDGLAAGDETVVAGRVLPHVHADVVQETGIVGAIEEHEVADPEVALNH